MTKRSSDTEVYWMAFERGCGEGKSLTAEDHPEAYGRGHHSEREEGKELPGERGIREGAYVRSLC